MRGELQQEISERGLRNVVLQGPAAREAMPAVYGRSQILLVTSIREGTPTVMLEALAAGLPVVSTPCNDFGEIIGTEGIGDVVGSWNPAEIAEAIERLLASPARMEAASVGARGRARAYSWDSIARKVDALMDAEFGEARNAR